MSDQAIDTTPSPRAPVKTDVASRKRTKPDLAPRVKIVCPHCDAEVKSSPWREVRLANPKGCARYWYRCETCDLSHVTVRRRRG